MNLLAVSISHHTAPVELREAIYLNNDEIKAAIDGLKKSLFNEGLVLSTCNRTEIYGIPKDTNTSYLELQKFLISLKPVDGIASEHFNNYFSCGAVRHLFKVISGIDSLLIGDNQIYHQVKDSFQFAEDLQFTGFLMKRVFDSAIKTGKRAITETEISEGAVTVSYAAVQLIEKIFSNLSKKSALVIGTGETGEIAAKHLRDKGIGKLSLTNRTIQRAEKLAAALNAKIIPFDNFKNNLAEFDIVLSATSSPDFILSFNDINTAMKKRNFSPTILMDIAVPRDIDPKVKEIDYVFYHDIDSMNIIVEQNLAKRKMEIPKVEKIVMEELTAFFSWYNSLQIAPTIKNLREYFEQIRAEEVSKNINRFSDEDKEKLEIVTKRIINKILHTPTIELKKITESGINTEESAIKISIIRDLFRIDNSTDEGE
jgi:glutamyl-tRNA reductase